MTPCSSCARHVRHGETACPFCGEPFVAPAPRSVALIGRVTRAAVFSAALAGCAKHEQPKPAPHAGSAENLDQDFNQLVGSAEQGSAVAQTIDAAAPDAAQVAVPVDAMTDEERTRQLQKQQQAIENKKQQERERREHEKMVEQQQLQNQQHWNAKPYGAPPARRRIV